MDAELFSNDVTLAAGTSLMIALNLLEGFTSPFLKYQVAVYVVPEVNVIFGW